MTRQYEHVEDWWIDVNLVAVLVAFFRAERQTDAQRRSFVVEHALPCPVGDVCTHCGHGIDSECCWCGDSAEGHGYGDGHSFVPNGCHCGFADASRRQIIPPMVPR